MKKLYVTLVALLTIVQFSFAQWTTGTNINNTNTGNVGIGTTSPNAKLDINGTPIGNGFHSQTAVTFGTVNGGAGALADGLTIQRLGSGGVVKPALKLANYFTANAAQDVVAIDFVGGDGSGVFSTPLGRIAVATSDVPVYMAFTVDDAERLRISNSGNIGIGTSSPSSKLEIKGGSTTIAAAIDGIAVSTTNSNFTTKGRIGSNFDGNYITQNAYYDGANWLADNNARAASAITLTTNNADGNIGFYTSGSNNAGLGTQRMTIDKNGYVGIGTTTPKEALSVNGNIRSKQIKVETNNWPDYVFNPTYTLPSLKDVKTYIDKYQHLPEMPSEAEVTKDGLNLGEIVKLQTKKIEELTLYLIDKDEQVNHQNAKLKQQDDRIDALEKALIKLTGGK
jgi:hypothetical protein